MDLLENYLISSDCYLNEFGETSRRSGESRKPESECCDLGNRGDDAWIPAFAGMTEVGGEDVIS